MNWLTAFLGYTAGAVLAILPIVNPLGAVPNNTVTVVSTGVLGLSSGTTDGWRFDSVTGELIGDQ